jgi:hypothetical protein
VEGLAHPPGDGRNGRLTQVFASFPDGTYAKVVDETVRRLTFRQVQGRPAIVLGLAGDVDPCRHTPLDGSGIAS